MISKRKVNLALEKLLNSEQFASSDFDKNFLKYLATKSLEGKTPKETTIAIELFNKDASFDPSSDSIVRTHMHSLRKKLHVYYLTEGQYDPIRIEIPKGKYKIEFAGNKTNKNTPSSSQRPVVWATLISFVICAAVFIFLYLSGSLPTVISHETQSNYSGSMWDDLFASDLPTQIVLGDYFIFVEENYGNDGHHRIRSGSINSTEELMQYYEKYPQYRERFLNITQTYIDLSVVEAGFAVFRFFDDSRHLKQSFASRLSADEVEHQNIIFVGPLETMRVLRYYAQTQNSRIVWQADEGQVLIQHSKNIKNYEKLSIDFDEDHSYYKNYGIVIKAPGPNQNTLFFIAVFSPRALTTLATILINGTFEADALTKLADEYDELPRYFEALLEFNTVNDIVNHEIIEFFAIKSKSRNS